MENKTIAITGGTGFVGSRIVKELLKYDVKVSCLVRKSSDVTKLPADENLKIKVVDFEDMKHLANCLSGISIVIHLIGQLGGYGIKYETFYKTNYELTQNILKASSIAGVEQFIFCSTPGVQGFGRRLAVETDDYNPRNDYEKTKVLAEEYILDYCKDKKIKYTILRPDFVYGPGDFRRVKMYKNIKNRKFILTTNGKSYLHPTYIDDVVDGFLKSIGNSNAYNEIFNLSALEDVTVLDYLNSISAATGSRLLHINIGYRVSGMLASAMQSLWEIFLHKEAFVTKNKIDFLAIDHSTSNEKARQKLGYEPSYPVKYGMKKTIEWCEQSGLL